MQDGRIHKIAVLCKDHYSIRTIDDLFIFAGADPEWWEKPTRPIGGERITHVYGWVAGIKNNAPGHLDRILSGVGTQLAENEEIPEGDRAFLRRSFRLSSASDHAVEGERSAAIELPGSIEELLQRLIRGLPRATFPLRYRRKDLPAFDFDNEYDIQSLFHTLLRPWVRDIRVEEYTPSYAGKSTRIDFLLPAYKIVVEIKYVRNAQHAKEVGDELIIDIAHYRAHPECSHLWAVVYDPQGLIQNPAGLEAALEGRHADKQGTVHVRTFILAP